MMVSICVKNFRTQKPSFVNVDLDELNFLSAANKAVLKTNSYNKCKAWIAGHNDIMNKINIFCNICMFKNLSNEDEDFV
jgi:hypothetical protein